MKPKEKAEKLLSEYLIYFPEYYNDLEYDYNVEKAKQCALIAVDEILNNDNNFFNTYSQNDYWLQVKQEIEKL
jgi:hypothetical protein